MAIFLSTILILAGIAIPSAINVSNEDRNILRLLWLYHLIFCFYYYFFIRVDSYGYYLSATERMTSQDFWDTIATSGTDFIKAICYVLVRIGFSSYFSLMLLFSLIGYSGIILFYKTVLQMIPTNSHFWKIRLFPFLFFFPNLHLWSVAVGKDSFLFFLIALFVYSLLRLKKRFLWLIFSVFVAYYIRPHVALILIVSLGIASFFRKDVSPIFRVFLVIALIGIATIVFPIVIEHFNINEESAEGITEFMDKASQGLSYGGSAVDISNYPYLFKLLTFLYRPFFFDINGVPALIISFENLLLLLLTICVLWNQPIKTFKNAPFVIQFALCFFAIGSLIFCVVISNLGNIIRQRNMFLPCMIIYILWSFSYHSILLKNIRRHLNK